ncbi:endonuclease [Candidatus Kaiserbacteria bacterium CG_4_8_14_3_um_filter_38_9]|uniref:Endonuclease n=1 Tax=Candidatus Kaiserbacteria bacterium CG_4_8_14_3_um_filter_38_9 TaxID=1974599 RepID=A0A2M7IMY4_9BACT|nr:MAG: endonuclease [Candidatus Kaiserbacteria bacterium CG_4_8_14_3_um_filter_38_9]
MDSQYNNMMESITRRRSTVRKMYEYISGYTDGEGCFSVSFLKREKLKIGIETRPSFSVSQNENRAEVLYLMQETFVCGHLRRDYSDKTLKYEVRKLEDLLTKIIPHFRKYPMLSGKRTDFEHFAKICKLMKNGGQHTKSGMQKIINLAFQMNPSGKRKYKQAELLALLR